MQRPALSVRCPSPHGEGQLPQPEHHCLRTHIEDLRQHGGFTGIPEKGTQQMLRHQQFRGTPVRLAVEYRDPVGAAPDLRRMAQEYMAEFMSQREPLAVDMVAAVDADEPVPDADEAGDLIGHVEQTDNLEASRLCDLFDGNRRHAGPAGIGPVRKRCRRCFRCKVEARTDPLFSIRHRVRFVVVTAP